MTTLAKVLGGRFTGLTIVVLVLWLSVNGIRQKEVREVVVTLAFSVLLVFAIRSVGRRLRIATVALAVPTLIGHWTLQVSGEPMLRYVTFAFTSVFLAFLTLVLMFVVFRDQTVTADTIVGAVCAYLLIGVTWGTAYALLVLISPDGLSVSPALAHTGGWDVPTMPFTPFTPLLQYYSFTTLATLGYGDVTPLSAGARALSVLEGLTGQLYLAVLIARLVGIHTARALK
jgi:hypothetical protein